MTPPAAVVRGFQRALAVSRPGENRGDRTLQPEIWMAFAPSRPMIHPSPQLPSQRGAPLAPPNLSDDGLSKSKSRGADEQEQGRAAVRPPTFPPLKRFTASQSETTASPKQSPSIPAPGKRSSQSTAARPRQPCLGGTRSIEGGYLLLRRLPAPTLLDTSIQTQQPHPARGVCSFSSGFLCLQATRVQSTVTKNTHELASLA